MNLADCVRVLPLDCVLFGLVDLVFCALGFCYDCLLCCLIKLDCLRRFVF